MSVPRYLTDSVPGKNGWAIGLAHRGADVNRENSLVAMKNAVQAGFGYIEIDVRTTADGKVVVFHDETLDRTTTSTGKISDYTWEELKQVRLTGPINRDGSVAKKHSVSPTDLHGTGLGEPLILLDDLLTELPKTRFNIDLKDKVSAAPTARIIQRRKAWDRVLIASFKDSHRKAFFQTLGTGTPQVASSAGTETMAVLLAAHHLGMFSSAVRWLRRRLPLDAIQVPIQQGLIRIVTPEFIAACHKENIAVHVWVVNFPDQMRWLLDMGVDGLVTDEPDALAEVLTVRGQWPQTSK